MRFIKLKIKTSEIKIVEIYLNFLKNSLNKFNIKYKLINLPKKIQRITLLKSPHVYKKAREQFEKKIFKTIILIETKGLNLNFLKFLIINKPKPVLLKLRYN